MYRLMVYLHIVISCLFMITAVVITLRSVTGWYKNLKYTNADKYFALLFLILLYITLINGIILYFFIDPALKNSVDIQSAAKRVSLRFWVIEHFYSMTFALVLSQIGGVFIRKTSSDTRKFVYASFYYGVATLITVISLTFYFIYR